MATPNYGLPEISGTSKINIASDVNALATATDTALKQLADNTKQSLDGKAPTNHASTATTYGVATASNYGHVRIASDLSGGAGTVPSGAAVSAAISTALNESRFKSMGVIGDSWGLGYYGGAAHVNDGWAVKLRDMLGIGAGSFVNASVNGSGIGDNVATTFSDQIDTIKASIPSPDLVVICGGQNDRNDVSSANLAQYKNDVTAFFNKLETEFPNSEVHFFMCPLGYNHVDNTTGGVLSPYITILAELVRCAQAKNVICHNGCVTWGNWVGQVNADTDTRHLKATGYTLVAQLMKKMIMQGIGDFWDADSDTGEFGDGMNIGSASTRCFTNGGVVEICCGGRNNGDDITATTSNNKDIMTLPEPFGSLQTRYLSTTTRGSTSHPCQFKLSANKITLVSGTWGKGELLGISFTYPAGS